VVTINIGLDFGDVRRHFILAIVTIDLLDKCLRKKNLKQYPFFSVIHIDYGLVCFLS